MSSTIAAIPISARPHKRFTVDEYHQLIRLGIVTKHDRCELIRGFVVEKPRMNPPHASTLSRVLALVFPMTASRATVRVQQPITLVDSEPQPDFAIVVGGLDDYTSRHPGPSDICIVMEIADSSLRDDQTSQLELYAENRIPEYWIVNIPDRRVEVYTQPDSTNSAHYLHRRDYDITTEVPVTISGVVVGSIPVREILPT